MAIAIRQTSDQVARSDGYLDSLAKLVPGEVLVAYAAAIRSQGLTNNSVHHWIIMALFTVLTPVLLYLSSRRAHVSAPKLQYVMRTAAFALLAISMDEVLMSPTSPLAWIPNVASLVIIALAAYILAPAN
jgi:hypothetical protein